MKCYNYCFESSNQLISLPFMLQSSYSKCDFYFFLTMFRLYFPLFSLHFSRNLFAFTCHESKVMKSSFLNHFIFYFQTKVIKLALQLSPLFLLCIINNSFSELPDCSTVWYIFQENHKNSYKKVNQFTASQVQSLKDHVLL